MISIQEKKKWRLFFALWPSETERTALALWQPLLHELCDGRAMRPATLHVTLMFLGEVAENRLEALQLAAREVDFQRFYLELLEAHYWGHNHIVYAAPEVVPSQHTSLVNELQSKLLNHRFQFEQRPYKPHVTLLRNAKWSDAPLPRQSKVCWQVSDFVLVQSLSDEQGACYEVLARFSAKAD
ncbi:RNA 2',3'-cyclic phosphodiesterase [Candidatus Nitrotoga sp. 1052]|uniref:RNA 2',3'-cyclic phosphodiesterase n=1 Tax=Candidatus Nitrotoga sp. 1052 TaxID=2886964 RepID=UPI001EF6B316|nr:RNA 2',3'-cyclic phosphodiesterase [Candidatus Nitrotoga sp. 1052]CAH1081073.1 RNA 2',3'-cyclic phosphodiesterase [Candidatus Nitrotoga sp. 1052]